ncbi:hypothetical protein AB9E09_35110, partial [Rhizobium leguminosarum]
LPSVLTGALVTETVFTWPVMGRLFLDSLGYSDYPVVMGSCIPASVIIGRSAFPMTCFIRMRR